MSPRLAALVLLVPLAACGGPGERPATPAGDGLVGTADVERSRSRTPSPLRRHPPRRRRHQGHRPLRPGAGQADHRRHPHRRPDPAKLQPGARGAEARCGSAKVRVVEIGGTIACTITLGDAVQKVTAVVKDLQGTVLVRS